MIESPRDVLRRHGLSARKSFGQHFLHAMHVHQAIATALELTPGQRVIEIGAGLGTLTSHLLAAGGDVWAIERDRDLCTVLRQEFKDAQRLQLHEADAVRFDYEQACEGIDPKPAIAGNLPYNLTGPLLFALLRHHQRTNHWVVLIQKEVADRLCAPPGSKTYGGVTVALSRVRAINPVLEVPPGCFVPPPRVDSTVIRLSPLPEPRGHVPDEGRFLELVRTAFQQRRKTLSNALSPLGAKDEILRWCDEADVDPKLRPERISVEGFAGLARARDRDRDRSSPDA